MNYIGPIQKNVPIPSRCGSQSPPQMTVIRLALCEMEVGECREIEYPAIKTPAHASQFIHRAAHHGKMRVSVRKTARGTLAVWRIA